MVASLYTPAEEQQSIWVYLEQENGVLENVSLEILTKGRELADGMGWQLTGVLLGHNIGDISSKACAYGADVILFADHPLLKNFTIEAYSQVINKAILDQKPSVFLLGATPNGRDLAGRLAVRLRTGLNADCTELRMEGESGVLVCEVSGFGGGVLALIEMRSHRPQMATIRPGVFEPKLPKLNQTSQLIELDVTLNAESIQTRVIERMVGEQIDLARVPVIVAGGRGIDGEFESLRKLAKLLGGDIGATRPPVDDGHIPREYQIGQTGVVCSPEVAICCGISGAFHFIVGIEKANTVISINIDPDAPIFEFSDFCIVGDVREIVPRLIKALEATQETTYAKFT